MRLELRQNIPPEAVGAIIEEQFREGRNFVHLANLPFADMAELDTTAYIRTAMTALGDLTLSNGQPGSELWLLDSMTSPNASHIPFHTDSPFLTRPEKIVSFWNLRSSVEGGHNLILPVNNLLEWLHEQGGEQRDLLAELATEPVTHTFGSESTSETLLDEVAGTARYDMKYIDPQNNKNLAGRLATQLEGSRVPASRIKLAPGDVLVFNNLTTLHARSPYRDSSRQSIRVRVAELT
jgi:alpha-ketoglutarate-dependent taurine dioxygenase